MRLANHHMYQGRQWTVESFYSCSESMDILAAGALELEIPYMVDAEIPSDFDNPTRFIDRTNMFHTIAVAEKTESIEAVNLSILHSIGTRAIQTMVEIPSIFMPHTKQTVNLAW